MYKTYRQVTALKCVVKSHITCQPSAACCCRWLEYCSIYVLL